MINIFLYQYYNEGIKIDIDFLNHFLLKDALKQEKDMPRKHLIASGINKKQQQQAKI